MSRCRETGHKADVHMDGIDRCVTALVTISGNEVDAEQ